MRVTQCALPVAVLLIEGLIFAQGSSGQSRQIHPRENTQPEVVCRASPPTTQSYKRKLWDGYEISLGPAANSQGGGEDQCTAAIYNKAGRVVYRTTGFNVTFNEN